MIWYTSNPRFIQEALTGYYYMPFNVSRKGVMIKLLMNVIIIRKNYKNPANMRKDSGKSGFGQCG